MDLVALVISLFAFGVAVVAAAATHRQANAAEKTNERADEANAIAREALAESRKAVDNGLWSGVVEAANRVLIDPAREPIGDKLATLRIRLTELVDGLPDWEGLDDWLAAELALGAVLGAEVSARTEPKDSPARRLSLLRPYQDWGLIFIKNLRHLRNVGYSPEVLGVLTANAQEQCIDVHSRNGWDLPTPPAATPLN